jgi:uncharacterized protein YcnI
VTNGNTETCVYEARQTMNADLLALFVLMMHRKMAMAHNSLEERNASSSQHI